MSDLLLQGKTAVVTGGGSGLGRECALALARAGAQVALVGRSEARLLETKRLLGLEGRDSQAEIFRCDVTDDSQLADIFSRIHRCDVLINNAGANVPEAFVDVSPSTLDELLRLNVRAAFTVAQSAVRRMIPFRSGVVINMSSQMGHVGAASRTVYCMTKHAVEGLTKAMAVELAPLGIRVNSIAPTFIETSLTRPFLQDDRFRHAVLQDIPLGRLGTAGEVASAVVFLASPGASLITGTSLRVDGGYTAH
jgi:NAD(P)-dependent dehydrogenase (short-subunit alcohol dehydrogenase family)